MTNFIYIQYLILFLNTVNSLNCNLPSFENLNVQSDFDLKQFLGIWYEIKWLPSEPHNESDIWRDYYQSFQLEDSSSHTLQVPGKARLLNQEKCFSFGPWTIIANNSAKMIVQKKSLNTQTFLNWPYYILQTDYKNYALIYACTSENYTLSNPCLHPAVWVFSRTTTLSTVYMTEVDDYMTNILCINLTELEITPHDGEACYSLSNICDKNLVLLIFLFLTSIIKKEREFI
ncbi:hypothetical protein I4U23_025279 [Adineta vaga]|nr:hypothetical protein I4U23_025279 [Adineta vaga]